MTHHRDGQIPLRRGQSHHSFSPETPLDPMSALAQHFAGTQAPLMFSALPGAPVQTDRQRRFPALRRAFGSLLGALLGGLVAARPTAAAPRSVAAPSCATACHAGTVS